MIKERKKIYIIIVGYPFNLVKQDNGKTHVATSKGRNHHRKTNTQTQTQTHTDTHTHTKMKPILLFSFSAHTVQNNCPLP